MFKTHKLTWKRISNIHILELLSEDVELTDYIADALKIQVNGGGISGEYLRDVLNKVVLEWDIENLQNTLET